jgi:hypothetical protein
MAKKSLIFSDYGIQKSRFNIISAVIFSIIEHFRQQQIDFALDFGLFTTFEVPKFMNFSRISFCLFNKTAGTYSFNSCIF